MYLRTDEVIGLTFLVILCLGTWFSKGKWLTVFWFFLYGIICSFFIGFLLFFFLNDLHHAGDSPNLAEFFKMARGALGTIQIPTCLAILYFFYKGITEMFFKPDNGIDFIRKTIIATMLLIAFGFFRDVLIVQGGILTFGRIVQQAKPAAFGIVWSLVFLFKPKVKY